MSSYWVIIEERSNGVNVLLMEIGDGSRNVADRVQYKARSRFLSVYRKKGKEIHKAFKDAERGVLLSSCNHRYILWSNSPLECFVISKLISTRTIGKSDGGVFSSSYLVVNVTEISTCHCKIYLANLLKIALQM